MLLALLPLTGAVVLRDDAQQGDGACHRALEADAANPSPSPLPPEDGGWEDVWDIELHGDDRSQPVDLTPATQFI